MNKSRVLVIIPAYNEEKSIGRVIKKVQENIAGADVVVIDDGSTDRTVKFVREAGARVLSHCVNLGPSDYAQGYQWKVFNRRR